MVKLKWSLKEFTVGVFGPGVAFFAPGQWAFAEENVDRMNLCLPQPLGRGKIVAPLG